MRFSMMIAVFTALWMSSLNLAIPVVGNMNMTALQYKAQNYADQQDCKSLATVLVSLLGTIIGNRGGWGTVASNNGNNNGDNNLNNNTIASGNDVLDGLAAGKGCNNLQVNQTGMINLGSPCIVLKK